MNDSIQIDRDLLGEAQRFAVESGQTLKAIVEEALREKLSKSKPAAEEPAQSNVEPLPTFSSGGTLPGVNLDSNAELREYLEEVDPESRYKCF